MFNNNNNKYLKNNNNISIFQKPPKKALLKNKIINKSKIITYSKTTFTPWSIILGLLPFTDQGEWISITWIMLVVGTMLNAEDKSVIKVNQTSHILIDSMTPS